jgi:hypothetical protein
MNRHEVIERIREFNPTASTDFLAGFADRDLSLYLDRLSRLSNHRGPATGWVRPELAVTAGEPATLFSDLPQPAPTREAA